MAENGKLQLELVDVYGDFIGEKIDVLLRNQVLSGTKKASARATKKVIISGLNGFPQGNYRIEIDPPSYLSVSQFVNVKASGVTDLKVVFPVDPKKVKGINPTKFNKLSDDAQRLLTDSAKVLSFAGKTGEKLYDALDNIRRAGLLNIMCKAQAVSFESGKSVLSFISELRELRGDRFFAVVSRELREETKNSVADGLFHEVSGSLHKLPPEFVGFRDAGSFKTDDRYGNLQLTFFLKGEECVVDVDIDDAAGLKHVFQVIHNALPGNSTHPYAIHNLLVVHQKLDPGYTFVV